jgi:ligand-binding sensor domain-containing protein/two-component sensor histidine kinase
MKKVASIKIVLAFTILIALTSVLLAQDFKVITYEKITSENEILVKGLSQNSVYCMMQDSKGFLWFGTWDGLNKYDGYEFTIFKPSLNYPQQGISHQTINALYEDQFGKIWIGTDGGLNIYDREADSFIQYFCGISSISNDTITAITEDFKGNVWIGTKNGLNKYNPETKDFEQFFHKQDDKDNSIINNHISYLIIDRKQNLWIGTIDGICKYDIRAEQFGCFCRNEKCNCLEGENILCIYQDKSSNIWTGTTNGLYKWDTEEQNLYRYKNIPGAKNSLSNNNVSAIYEDWFGFIWIGTLGGGLNKLDPVSNEFVKLDFEGKNRKPHNDFINQIFEDKSGILWVCTAWNGVSKIDRATFRFKHYKHTPSDNSGLNTNIVWSIYENEETQKVWIGTNNGINIFDRKNNAFTYLKHKPGNPNSPASNEIRDIIKDSKGRYWIAYFDAGFSIYYPEENKYRHFKHEPGNKNSIPSNHVWKIFEDSRGNFWIGTNNGLSRIIDDSFRVKNYFYQQNKKHSLSNNSIFSIYEDSENNLWFCTYNGLNLYLPDEDGFYAYKHEDGNPNSLSINSVFSIYEDKKGIYWIATMGGGLNRFNKKTNEFIYYTEDNGLANNVVYRILEDKNDNLWISTNHGISRFNTYNETFINYDVKDGIQSYEFNHNPAYKNKKGEMYFGGMNGFNLFNPSIIQKNEYVPKVTIIDFHIFNELVKKEIQDGDTIILSHDKNFFSFKFAALDFTNPQKNKYRYRLKNFNKAWIKTDADKRFAEYTKVEPGTYIFQVKGSNNDGVWNENATTVTIIVKPPWWATWTFRIPFGLFLISSIWYAISRRFKSLRRKHDVEKKMLTIEKQFIEVQQKALRLQMNPHFIFNSLNSIQHFIIEQDEESAHMYLANFSSLMRKILENSKYNQITLSEDLATIELYLELEKLRFTNHFSYNIDIEESINPNLVKVPPMLLQPYLENAIWHGLMPKKNKGKLEIKIERFDKNTLVFRIIDDGIGREKAAEITRKRKNHKSTGMKNIEDRIALMNDLNNTKMKVKIIDLYDDDKNAVGTEVNLYISYL